MSVSWEAVVTNIAVGTEPGDVAALLGRWIDIANPGPDALAVGLADAWLRPGGAAYVMAEFTRARTVELWRRAGYFEMDTVGEAHLPDSAQYRQTAMGPDGSLHLIPQIVRPAPRERVLWRGAPPIIRDGMSWSTHISRGILGQVATDDAVARPTMGALYRARVPAAAQLALLSEYCDYPGMRGGPRFYDEVVIDPHYPGVVIDEIEISATAPYWQVVSRHEVPA